MAVHADTCAHELSEPTPGQAHTDGLHADDIEEECHTGNDADIADDVSLSTDVRLALTVGLVVIAAMTGLFAWLGFRAYESNQAQHERHLFVQVARQSALNLSTIDYTKVDDDVQRILDLSTGSFRDDFQKRSGPFIEVVKQAQSKSEGSVVEAGMESVEGDQAQVLIALNVKTSNAGAQDQEPRAWRMRIHVQKVGEDAKVTNVEFVP